MSDFQLYPHIDNTSILPKFYGKQVLITYKSDGSNFRVKVSRSAINKASREIDGLFYNFGSRTRELTPENSQDTWLRAIQYFIDNDLVAIQKFMSKDIGIISLDLIGEWLGEIKQSQKYRCDPDIPNRLIVYFDQVVTIKGVDEQYKYWDFNSQHIKGTLFDTSCFTKIYRDTDDFSNRICTPELIYKIIDKQDEFSDLYEGVVIRPIGNNCFTYKDLGLWNDESEWPVYVKVKTNAYMAKEGKSTKKVPVPPTITEAELAVINGINFEDILHSFQSSYPEFGRGDIRAYSKLIPFVLDTVSREVLDKLELDKQSRKLLLTISTNHLKTVWITTETITMENLTEDNGE